MQHGKIHGSHPHIQLVREVLYIIDKPVHGLILRIKRNLLIWMPLAGGNNHVPVKRYVLSSSVTNSFFSVSSFVLSGKHSSSGKTTIVDDVLLLGRSRFISFSSDNFSIQIFLEYNFRSSKILLLPLLTMVDRNDAKNS
jgi:hypothetical protein